jgi:hypothetical protein
MAAKLTPIGSTSLQELEGLEKRLSEQIDLLIILQRTQRLDPQSLTPELADLDLPPLIGHFRRLSEALEDPIRRAGSLSRYEAKLMRHSEYAGAYETPA